MNRREKKFIGKERPRCQGCYGGIAKTPNIDCLAGSGMVLTNTIVAVSKMAPSSASFVTGRLAWRNGVFGNGFAPAESLRFLEKYLATETEATREIDLREDPEVVKHLRSLWYLGWAW